MNKPPTCFCYCKLWNEFFPYKRVYVETKKNWKGQIPMNGEKNRIGYKHNYWSWVGWLKCGGSLCFSLLLMFEIFLKKANTPLNELKHIYNTDMYSYIHIVVLEKEGLEKCAKEVVASWDYLFFISINFYLSQPSGGWTA